MAVYKRFRGKRVATGDENYEKGVWNCEVMIDGMRYKKSIKSAKTKKEAEEDLIIAKIRYGEFDLFKDKTKLADFVDQTYLPYCKLNNANYRQKIYETNSLKSFFKNIPIKSITPEMCEKYKTWRLSQKKRCQKCISNMHNDKDPCRSEFVSNSTVNRDLTTLKRLLTIAADNRKLKENPMGKVNMLPEAEPRTRFLNEDEKKRLFAAIGDDQRLMAIVLIGLLTGWRKGQILGIRKRHLDAANMAVTIKKSKRCKERLVPVSLMIWNIFSVLAENAEDFLFVNRDGDQLGDFKDQWWKALEKAGITDFHFHDLRHTFATDMIAAGGQSVTVQAALGHANIKTTGIYTHVSNENLRNALELISRKNSP
jgi:integrase